MDWTVNSATSEVISFAQACVLLSAEQGWSVKTLNVAACQVFDNQNAWKSYFPNGCVDVIWFISTVSDQSMVFAFQEKKAQNLPSIVKERLDQNATLKPFVKKVMVFDVMHPFQALKRMQRTSWAMFECLDSDQSPRFARTAWANLMYTLVVFIWLIDRSEQSERTHKICRFLFLFV